LGGITVPKYSLTMSGYSRSAVFAVAVIDDFGLVLSGHTCEVLALCLGNPQLLVGLLDGLGNHVPILGLLTLRLDVVVDVVEVDRVEQTPPTPLGDGLAQESLIGAKTELQHPLRLPLHRGHVTNDVLVETLSGLESKGDLVSPTELVAA
jgi:hypothetical protein